MPPLKILTFAASNSTKSINQSLAMHAGDILLSDRTDAVVTPLDLNDFEMPIFSPERESQGIPTQAHDFYDRLGTADGVILSLAEYNGSYTAAFKNVFDWTSRIKMQIFQDKPMLLLSTSTGGRGGQGVMSAAQSAFPHFGAKISSSFSFGPFAEHFSDGALHTPALQADLKAAVTAFAKDLPAHTAHSSFERTF